MIKSPLCTNVHMYKLEKKMISSKVVGICHHIFKSSRPDDSDIRYSIQLLASPVHPETSAFELHTFKLPKAIDVLETTKKLPNKLLEITLETWSQNGKSGFYIPNEQSIRVLEAK